MISIFTSVTLVIIFNGLKISGKVYPETTPD